MGCDYYESTILYYEYTFRGELFVDNIKYSTEKMYIFESDSESYEEVLKNKLDYEKETDTTTDKEYVNSVLSEIYSKHDFSYPNETFISQFNSVTDYELESYVKINNELYNNSLTVDELKNKINNKNNILLKKLNQINDVKIIKIICKLYRWKRP